MIKKLTLVLFVFLGLCSAAFAQDNNINKFLGTWTGTYEDDGQVYTASVIFKEADGKLTGMAESTENPSGEPMAVENIQVKGDSLKFEIMGAIKYSGIYKEKSRTIEGTLIGMEGQIIKFNMTLKPEPGLEISSNTFIGTWKSKFNGDGTEKTFILVLNLKDGKLSGTLESPEQNTGLIPLDNINIDGNKLSFGIEGAGASYEGVYKAETKTIEGVGVENQNAVNINFVKEEKAPVK